MVSTLVGVSASFLYLLGALYQLNAFRTHQPSRRAVLWSLLVPALLLHALSLRLVMLQPQGIDLGLLPIAALIALVMVLLVALASAWQTLDGLFVLMLPLAALTVLAAQFSSGATHAAAALSPGLITHALLALSGYTVLAMAATTALALWWQEQGLKTHSRFVLLRLLPPLLSMERLLFQLLWAGFFLLTGAIVSGFVFLTDLFGQRVAHHSFFALVAWLIFAALLAGHHWLGWRGRMARRWTLTGFAFLALAYFGSKFVIEILLA